MTTIHLVYSTLEHVLDTREKNTITLIQRNIKIKKILTDYHLLPSVINDIIFEYTDSKINMTGYIEYIDTFLCNFYLVLLTTDYKIMIHIDRIDGNVNIGSELSELYGINENVICLFHSIGVCHCIPYFNAFMKIMYNRYNYINCDNTKCSYFMHKNTILRVNENNLHLNGIVVKDYRKFTYMIVILKCIINGIKKYFKEHDIKEYCKKLN